jgi:hypothetical protein
VESGLAQHHVPVDQGDVCDRLPAASTIGSTPQDHEVFGARGGDHVSGVRREDDLQLRSLLGDASQVPGEGVLQLRVEVRLRLLDEDDGVERLVREERVLLELGLHSCLRESRRCALRIFGDRVLLRTGLLRRG